MVDPEESRSAWSEPPGAPEEDPLLGTTLNDTYRITSVLGEGGMGRVYGAEHTRIAKKRFAVKMLHPEYARERQLLARFRREAEIAAAIEHPHVVEVFDIDSAEDGSAYLVCEHLSGMELGDYVREYGTLDTTSVARLGRQLCSALEATHAVGVIHRDLKPANVFLVGDFGGALIPEIYAKVLDFGISRFQDDTGTTLTKTGTIMGTPAYMSPEQANGERGDKRTDVYGLGAILYTALTGKPPFEFDTPQATLLAVMSQEPVRPRSVNSSISEHVELVVQRAMSKNPADRYQTMDEFDAALAAFDRAEPAQSLESGERIRNRQPSRTVIDTDPGDVQSARLKLAGALMLAFIVSSASVSTSALSVLDLAYGGSPLSQVELRLVVLGVVGTLLTPTVLFIRGLRRTVWSNTARVLDLLHRVRPPLVMGLLSYALAALVVRGIDVVGSRLFTDFAGGVPNGIGWPGWSLVFLAVGALAAVTSALRLGELRTGSRVVALFARVAPALAVLVSGALVYQGLTWQTEWLPPAPSPAPLAAVAVTPAVPATPPALPSATAASSATAPPVGSVPAQPAARAPDEELAAAIAEGVDHLLPLSEKYPRDPSVLKPLVFAFASRATGYGDAVAIAERLFIEAPEQIADRQIGFILSKAAKSPGRAAKAALDLMAEQMGSSGADLLYDLSMTRSRAQPEASARLELPALQQKFSPALAIAYELGNVEGCEAKLQLLARAAQLGDARSIATLSPLAASSKRGCGRYKNKPCRAKCAAEAGRFMEAIGKINLRLAENKPNPSSR